VTALAFTSPATAGRRTVWVCRHARTDFNDAGVVSGWRPGRITPAGRRDLANATSWWASRQPDWVVSSPLGRAVDTARLLFGRVDDIDAAWVEQATPGLEAMTVAAAHRRWPELCHENGWARRDAPRHHASEHLESVTSRALTGLRSAAAAAGVGASVAVVSHGAVLVALLAAAGRDAATVPNLAVLELAVDPTVGWELVAVHDPLDT
jgi:broad specificity phosphatase PhoE